MRKAKFKDIDIYRPSFNSELRIRALAEKNLYADYKAGEYSDPELINSILQSQYKFYQKILSEQIPKIASRDFMNFLLYQYDQTVGIDNLFSENKLVEEQASQWSNIGPLSRRAIKYIAELTCALSPNEIPMAPKENLEDHLDNVWISSEELVNLYLLSDNTYMIAPEATTLTIYPEGSKQYLDISVSDACLNSFNERISKDTSIRTDVLGTLPFDQDMAEHYLILNKAFSDDLGMDYQHTMGLIFRLIEDAKPPENGFPIPFVNYGNVINGLSHSYKVSVKICERILSGFIISKGKMETEGRELFKPKQEYRALKRGFFEFPHHTGQHITWSKEMAKENFIHLYSNMPFKHIPLEWKGANINLAVERLSNEAGRWFERIVCDKLEGLGFYSLGSVKKVIGSNDVRINIPKEIGEMDYLGYLNKEKLLILIECKMVRGSTEAKYFRDDIQTFVNGEKSYVHQFNRKITWLLENFAQVCKSLASEMDIDINPIENRIATAIVTLYPNISSCFIKDFPCISIAELITEYSKEHAWPYKYGIFG